MPEALATMADVAAFRGVHYDTVRKGWRAWVRGEGFPAPVHMTGSPRWRWASLLAWAERREAANLAALLRRDDATDPVAPANENLPSAPPPAPAARGVDRQRDAVLNLMAAGAQRRAAAQPGA